MITPLASRRAFLKAMGCGAGLVPLLRTADTRAATRFPKRLIVVTQPNGIVHDNFWPQGEGTNLAGMSFPAVSKPLEKHRDRLIFVAGLEYTNFRRFYPASVTYQDGHHAFPHALTGTIGVTGRYSTSRPQDGASGTHPTGGSASLDQFYADEIAKATHLPFPLLTTGVRNRSNEWTINQVSFKGPDQPNQAENDPYALWKRLFADIGKSDGELERVRKERASILDFVGASIQRWSARLGAEDREKVARHLGAIREMEKGLATKVTRGCERPDIGAAVEVNSDVQIPKLLAAQMDNIVAAMACDLTRSATLMINHGGGDFTLSWLGSDFTSGGPLAGNISMARSHHDMAHAEKNNAEAKRLKTIAEAWYMQQFASLLDKLAAVEEGDGTLLDNTIVLWINNMGTGYDHSIKGVPWVLAGGANTGLRTGQRLTLGDWAAQGQRGTLVPQNGVLTAVANALLDRDLRHFGDAEFGGETPGLRR